MLSLPLGLLSLAAVLEGLGHQVSLVDFNYALSKGEISIHDDLYQVLATRIAALSPEVVGFSTMCNSYHMALRMAEAVKARLPGVPILFGGPQASVVDVETLAAFPYIDMILRGEAEQTLPLLLSALSSGQIGEVPGLTYRINGRVVRNSGAALLLDLDALPVPAYHLFPYGMDGSAAIDVGRGCPFSCTFCSTSTFWQHRFRLKSIDRIIQEMWMLKRKHDVTSFTLMHDLFTVNRRRLRAFCERLQTEQMDVTWSCSARVDCVDAPLLHLMASAGCRGVFYGVETGSPRMQREINKNLQLDQVWSAVNGTLNAEMSATVSFIAGFPAETEQDLCQTVDLLPTFLAHPEVNVQLHLLAPQTGTPDFDRYGQQLGFDGYYSDIAGAADKFLETTWFEQYPKLFSSFYYFNNDRLPRPLLRGLDLFVHGPCSTMRDTILRLLEGGRSLWGLYCEWRGWADPRGLGRGPMAGQSMDQFLLDFYAFVSDQVETGRVDLDLGCTQDEILAFYLRHYGQVPVRFVEASVEEESHSGMS